jgi:PAS domain S-box-containing protein
MSKHAHVRIPEISARGPERPLGAHDAVLTLNENGTIVETSPGAETQFGYQCAEELLGRHVSFLLPELARWPLLRGGDVNPRLAFLCHCGKRFTAARREGWAFFAELFINKVEGPGHGPLLVTVRPAGTARLQPDPKVVQQWQPQEATLIDR